MLSRLQELRKEEETLLRSPTAAEASVFPRSQVEELALQSLIRSREENVTASSAAAEEPQKILGQMDNEAAINQTELHLSLQDHEEEEEEEEEESDS
ncbi:SNPC5 protein, partial [Mesembrinibis cayennensis]|nr:SNPC5 protein [Mesembrinibis cayennensis]